MKKEVSKNKGMGDYGKNAVAGIVVTALIGIIIGVLMIALARTDIIVKVLHVTMIVVGVVTVAVNIPGIITGAMNTGEKEGVLTLVWSVIGVLFGILLIINQGPVISAMVALYLLIMPVVRLITAVERKAQLGAELPRLILGLVIAILFPGTLADGAIAVLCWILRIAGIVLTLLSVVYAVVGCILLKKAEKEAAKPRPNVIYADTTGDGKIDTVLFDDDRDGTVDRETPYEK